MRSIMDTKKHPDYSDAYQKIYGSLEEKKSGMSSDAMSSILKGNRYSGKELFNMSKKSTQQGRHGEAHALYKEFQKKKSTKEEVEPRVGRLAQLVAAGKFLGEYYTLHSVFDLVDYQNAFPIAYLK